MVNPYEMVYTHDDSRFHPSIALIKPLSRSYFKMIEILDVLQFYEQLPKQNPKVRSAHVAEGPGGFIQALSDTVERNKRILQQATAMTLKPTNNHVPGWRRASPFLHHHREVKLHYGVSGTGNVYEMANQDSFIEAITPGVHLFTADGGFDFSINYDIQEQRVYNLLVCSATVGLRSLHTDGSFVLKIFDIFSDSTILLISLMARCFREWTLYKPSLSRPCNSERYFLGRGFLRLSPEVMKLLVELQEKGANELYPVGVTGLTAEERVYIDEHVAVNRTEQIKAIEMAEKYAMNPADWYKTQMQADFQTSLAWCQRFHIPFTLTKPVQIHQVVYTFEPTVYPQSQLLDGDSNSHFPSAQEVPTLTEGLKSHNRTPSESQTDGDSREQTQGVAP